MVKYVLITGSSGFIGSHLVAKLLKEGKLVVGVDRLKGLETNVNYTHERGDICDEVWLQSVFVKYQPKTVFHLAARTDLIEGDLVSNYRDNIVGTEVIVRCVNQFSDVLLISASTQLVMSASKPNIRMHDYDPQNDYARSKVLAEKSVKDHISENNCWTIVRPTTVWGPRMGKHYLRFFGALQKGYYFHFGSRVVPKSYCYIDTAVQQLFWIAQNSNGLNRRVFYLADYIPIDLKTWVNNFANHLNANPPMTLPRFIPFLLSLVGTAVQKVLGIDMPLTYLRYKNITQKVVIPISYLPPIECTDRENADDKYSLTSKWIREEIGR
jgi:GlcNAc-P-P-Und epimerase